MAGAIICYAAHIQALQQWSASQDMVAASVATFDRRVMLRQSPQLSQYADACARKNHDFRAAIRAVIRRGSDVPNVWK
jgi:hypothetical protein